jgi:hypothetical protein
MTVILIFINFLVLTSIIVSHYRSKKLQNCSVDLKQSNTCLQEMEDCRYEIAIMDCAKELAIAKITKGLIPMAINYSKLGIYMIYNEDTARFYKADVNKLVIEKYKELITDL